MAKENIPTEEVVLKETGYKVVLYKHLTTGEARSLQRKMLETGEVDISSGNISNLKGTAFFDMQDVAIGYLVKEIYASDNQKIEFSRDWLDGLPIPDGNQLFDKVNDVTSASYLRKEVKKN